MKTQKLLFTIFAIMALHFNGLAITLSSTSPSSQTEASVSPKTKEQIRTEQLNQLMSMTAEQYGNFRGKKLNFFERVSFKLSQHRLKQMSKHFRSGDEVTTLQKISWLLKGLLFGPLALLVGYIFLKDEERELIKWIWFGFAGFVAIFIAFLLV